MKIAEDVAVYRMRREKLARTMQAGVAVIPTAPERVRNRDSHYPYRFDSHFYYLSGFAEPQAALVIVAGDKPRSLLFCRDRNEEREADEEERVPHQGPATRTDGGNSPRNDKSHQSFPRGSRFV